MIGYKFVIRRVDLLESDKLSASKRRAIKFEAYETIKMEISAFETRQSKNVMKFLDK